MQVNKPEILSSPVEKYNNPVLVDNRSWNILSTGTVKGQEIFCHLQEVDADCFLQDNYARQICCFLPLTMVFNSPDLKLIQQIIEFRIPSQPGEIATELCINWLILKQDGYTFDAIRRAITTGIELGILRHGYEVGGNGQTLHVY